MPIAQEAIEDYYERTDHPLPLAPFLQACAVAAVVPKNYRIVQEIRLDAGLSNRPVMARPFDNVFGHH